jgi:NADH dehydrogenase FAD-containing subunit
MDILTVLLLGDGFFARGFLHHIDYNKYKVTQIYKDPFINPQDMMYNLQRNKIYTDGCHFRNYFRDYLYKFLYKNSIIKKKMTIDSINIINKNEVEINKEIYNFDYLVIGLGAQKTLKDWSNEINEFISNKNNNLSVGIVGMGPIGLELGNILSNFKNINKVDMFDMLSKDKVLGYTNNKEYLLTLLNNKNISTTYEKMYNKTEYNHDKVFFCVGTRANNLTANLKVNNYLQIKINENHYYDNIYLGGDAINSTKYIKTGQLAYQQGKYVAERLNNNKEFMYKHNGLSLNLGDKKVLIENHNIVPNGIYPDFIIKLYSFLFV